MAVAGHSDPSTRGYPLRTLRSTTLTLPMSCTLRFDHPTTNKFPHVPFPIATIDTTSSWHRNIQRRLITSSSHRGTNNRSCPDVRTTLFLPTNLSTPDALPGNIG